MVFDQNVSSDIYTVISFCVVASTLIGYFIGHHLGMADARRLQAAVNKMEFVLNEKKRDSLHGENRYPEVLVNLPYTHNGYVSANTSYEEKEDESQLVPLPRRIDIENKGIESHLSPTRNNNHNSHSFPSMLSSTTSSNISFNDSENTIKLQPIGKISSIYKLCMGTPRQGLLAPHSRGRIDLFFQSYFLRFCIRSRQIFSFMGFSVLSPQLKCRQSRN